MRLGQGHRGIDDLAQRLPAEEIAERLIPAQFLIVEAQEAQPKGHQENGEQRQAQSGAIHKPTLPDVKIAPRRSCENPTWWPIT